MKELSWHDSTVQITKKNVKNVNFRIHPDKPSVICVSIPMKMSYEDAVQVLNQPRIVRWIEQHQKKRDERLTEKQQRENDRQKLETCYRERLKSLLPDLFLKWERRLGVRCNKVTIRDTHSQWGSCNVRTGNISVSVWLGAYPEECIEYVVVHELVHLLEPGHNARFYGLLDHYYPKWSECRKKLKEQGL